MSSLRSASKSSGRSRFTKDGLARLRASKLGEKNHRWKGEAAKYSAIHKWLVRNFGSPRKCSTIGCKTPYRRLQWALRKGYKHAHALSHYDGLCEPCHKKYDHLGTKRTAEQCKRISEGLKKSWQSKKNS